MRNALYVMSTAIGFITIGTTVFVNAASAETVTERLQSMPRYSSRHNTTLPAGSFTQDPDRNLAWDRVPGMFQSIVLHPSNPKVRFAIGQDRIVYRSTTAGDTWTALPSPFPNRIARLAVADGDRDMVYALGEGPILARSGDMGATWEVVGAGMAAGTSSNAGQILIDQEQPQHVFVADLVIWESWDSGKHFSQFNGAFGNESFTALAMNRGVLLAGSSGGSILRIVNDSRKNVSKPRNGEISSIVVDDSQPGKAYATYRTPKLSPREAQVYLSFDGAFSWNALDGEAPGGLPAIGVRSLAIDPSDSRRIYLATEAGVLVSLNGGSTWLREQSGFEDVTGIAMQSVDSHLKIVALSGHGRNFATLASSTCTFTLSPASVSFMAEGGAGTVNVKSSAAACTWQVLEGYSWITIVSGGSGKGDGSVSYRVAENGTRNSRQTYSLTIGGQPFTVKQSEIYACSYTLTPNKATFPNAGGTGSFAIQTPAGCAWKLKPNATITLQTPTTGTGPATVRYTVGGGSSPSTDHLYTIDLEGAVSGLWSTFQVTVEAASTPGSGTGNPSNGTSPPVKPIPFNTVTTASNMTGSVGQTITLKAIVNFGGKVSPGPNTVLFSINGRAVGDANVMSGGVATSSFKIPDSLTTLQVRADFLGNDVARPSSAQFTITVNRAGVQFDFSVGTDMYWRPTLNIRMTRTTDGQALGGKTVSLALDGKVFATVTTDSGGMASARYPVPTVCRNTLPFSAQFVGDSLYIPIVTNWSYLVPTLCSISR